MPWAPYIVAISDDIRMRFHSVTVKCIGKLLFSCPPTLADRCSICYRFLDRAIMEQAGHLVYGPRPVGEAWTGIRTAEGTTSRFIPMQLFNEDGLSATG